LMLLRHKLQLKHRLKQQRVRELRKEGPLIVLLLDKVLKKEVLLIVPLLKKAPRKEELLLPPRPKLRSPLLK